jgi:hypothetical protein
MLARLLERIALALEERRIPYMVIGGQAVLLYGEPRLTQDVDVALGAGPDRLGGILDLAKAQGRRRGRDKTRVPCGGRGPGEEIYDPPPPPSFFSKAGRMNCVR